MTDYYLKFVTESEMCQVLENTGCYNEGSLIAATFDYAVCIVGLIDGVSGFHVNWRQLRGELPSVLIPYVLNPSPTTPHRTWA